MINIIKMEIFRLTKSKSIYISLLVFIVLLLFMLWGQVSYTNVTMTTGQTTNIIGGTGLTLPMLVGSFVQSGILLLIVGTSLIVFFCEPYQCGFVKNVYATQVKKWKVCIANSVVIGIVFFIYMSLLLIIPYAVSFVLQISMLFTLNGNMIALTDILLFLSIQLLGHIVMFAIFLFIIHLIRSKSFTIIIFFITTFGLVDQVMSSILTYFNIDIWNRISLYPLMMGLPMKLSSGVRSLVLSATVIFVVFTIGSTFLMKKKDV